MVCGMLLIRGLNLERWSETNNPHPSLSLEKGEGEAHRQLWLRVRISGSFLQSFTKAERKALGKPCPDAFVCYLAFVTFESVFERVDIKALSAAGEQSSRAGVESLLAGMRFTVNDFPALLSPAAGSFLEELSHLSQKLTQQRFGKVLRFFAPLYVSNECINSCKYCGFSRDNPIARVTLSLTEVKREGAALVAQGFRNVLIVAGEHPKFISRQYLVDCVRTLRPFFPSISLEVGPLETSDYRDLVEAGAEGLVVYQETYDREQYANIHTAGPKRDFDFRLATAERAYAAGFRRLGIGALFGLADWRTEAISLALHTEFLLRHCWKAQITVSLPRLRPHAGHFEPVAVLPDRELIQLVCAFRLVFPDVGIVLSTREHPRLRDGLFPLGITHISAGSHTEPGGYTGAGNENVHLTRRGRTLPLEEDAVVGRGLTTAMPQFQIADERSCGEVVAAVERLGYEPVFKDWDAALGV
jgi:2-iminoacetate synthase